MARSFPEGWDGSRAVPEVRWTNDRVAPVRFAVRTEFRYIGNPHPCGGGAPAVGEDGRARHAFSRGVKVIDSDVPTQYTAHDGPLSHLMRAIECFGDDADLVIEVRRKDPAS